MVKVEPKWSPAKCNAVTQIGIVVMGLLPFIFFALHASSFMCFFYCFWTTGKRLQEGMGQAAVRRMFLLGGIAFLVSLVIQILKASGVF